MLALAVYDPLRQYNYSWVDLNLLFNIAWFLVASSHFFFSLHLAVVLSQSSGQSLEPPFVRVSLFMWPCWRGAPHLLQLAHLPLPFSTPPFILVFGLLFHESTAPLRRDCFESFFEAVLILLLLQDRSEPVVYLLLSEASCPKEGDLLYFVFSLLLLLPVFDVKLVLFAVLGLQVFGISFGCVNCLPNVLRKLFFAFISFILLSFLKRRLTAWSFSSVRVLFFGGFYCQIKGLSKFCHTKLVACNYAFILYYISKCLWRFIWSLCGWLSKRQHHTFAITVLFP